ncbi:cytochrome P450 family protein [Lentzea tibetensis]|nr:cytochrome P450 [Lentzea tibetensis]
MSTQHLIGGELRGSEHHHAEDEARAACPVHQARMPNGIELTVVTAGLEQARQVLSDDRLSKDSGSINAEQVRQLEALGLPPGVSVMFGQSMLFSDDPQHRRLRKLAGLTFGTRRVQQLRPHIERLTRDLIDTLPTGVPVDLITALAVPLPLQVICELLGIPERDWPALREWTEDLMTEDRELTLPASRAIGAYFQHQLLPAKRENPDDRLLSALVVASADGDTLSADELLAMSVLLVTAGHESTTNLIGNVVYELLRRDLWGAVAADTGLVDKAIEETLRWDPPVRNTPHRIAREDLEIGGRTVPEGSLLVVNLGAPSRCPATVDQPDEFLLTRDESPHVTFGHGIHFCLGAHLARVETQIVLRQLVQRFPHARLVTNEAPARRPSAIMSGYEYVHVVWES